MKTFAYKRARTSAEAATAATRMPDAKFIAGCTNLLDLMKLQIETPANLIDVNRLELNKIEPTPDGVLRLGGLLRNTDLAADPRVRREYSLLAHALPPGPRASYATKRRPPATSSSEPVAQIFYATNRPCNKRRHSSGGSAISATHSPSSL